MFLHVVNAVYRDALFGKQMIQVLLVTEIHGHRWYAVKRHPLEQCEYGRADLQMGHMNVDAEFVIWSDESCDIEAAGDPMRDSYLLWLHATEIENGNYALVESTDNEGYLCALPDIAFYA